MDELLYQSQARKLLLDVAQILEDGKIRTSPTAILLTWSEFGKTRRIKVRSDGFQIYVNGEPTPPTPQALKSEIRRQIRRPSYPPLPPVPGDYPKPNNTPAYVIFFVIVLIICAILL